MTNTSMAAAKPVGSVYQNHYMMTPSRKLMQGGIHRNKYKLEGGLGADGKDSTRQSEIDGMNSRGYVKPTVNGFNSFKLDSPDQKRTGATSLKKKLQERRAGTPGLNQSRGSPLPAPPPTSESPMPDAVASDTAAEDAKKATELEHLRAAQNARLQIAEQKVKELEANKVQQDEELALKDAQLHAAQSTVTQTETQKVAEISALQTAKASELKALQDTTAAERAEFEATRQADIAQSRAVQLQAAAQAEAAAQALAAAAAKEEAAGKAIAAAVAAASAATPASAPTAVTNVGGSEMTGTRIALRAVVAAKLNTEEDIQGLTHELAKILSTGAIMSEAHASAACRLMEQIGAKQGFLHSQEAEMESLQGISIKREMTAVTHRSQALAQQLLMSRKHVMTQQGSVGLNIDRRALAGVEMAINEQIAEKDNRLQQQDEQLNKATHLLKHAARVKELQDAKLAQLGSVVNGSGKELETLRLMQNYATRAHDAIREELTNSRNSVMIMDQQNQMLRDQLQMQSTPVPGVKMRKKKGTKSSSSLGGFRNRLSRAFSNVGGKKKNKSYDMEGAAPAPVATSQSAPVLNLEQPRLTVPAPPGARLAATPEKIQQRHSTIFSPNSSTV
jgi:hypothetical protein